MPQVLITSKRIFKKMFKYSSDAGEFKFTPPRTGRYALAAKFVSKEMDDVDGFIMIMVEPRKEQNGRT